MRRQQGPTAVIWEWIRAHERLAEERWGAHREKHADLAQQLTEYKEAANEWRATVTDIRAGSLTRPEFTAEHRALDSKVSSETNSLEVRIAALERAVQTWTDRDSTTRSILNTGRNLILLGIAIIGALITIAVYLARA